MVKDKDDKKMHTESAPYVAPKRRKTEDNKYYPATIRLPRPTQKKLAAYALEHNTSLQGLVAEAIDAYMRAHGIGTFLPEGWEE